MKKTKIEIPARNEIEKKLAELDAEFEADRAKIEKLKADLQKRLEKLPEIPDSISEENIKLVNELKAEEAIIKEQLKRLDELWENRVARYEEERKPLEIEERRIKALAKSVRTQLTYLEPGRAFDKKNQKRDYDRFVEACKLLGIWKSMEQWLKTWNAAVTFKSRVIKSL